MIFSKEEVMTSTGIVPSRLAYGCGSLTAWSGAIDAEALSRARALVYAAMEAGITIFDLANVYAYGRCETIFGLILKSDPSLRDKIVIQSKCGIQLSTPFDDPPEDAPHNFALNYGQIISDVEGSLRRLQVDCLDVLLLHRPSPLARMEEVARALDELLRQGKILAVGASNHNRPALESLSHFVDLPIVVNQIRIGLTHSSVITDALDFNRVPSLRFNPDSQGGDGILEYCRTKGVTVQAWSPIRGLFETGPESGRPANGRLDRVIREIAALHDADEAQIAVAWLLKHPDGIVPIIGSSQADRIRSLADQKRDLSDVEWWRLLYAATQLSSAQAI